MKNILCLFLLLIWGCRPSPPVDQVPKEVSAYQTPDQLLGDLFTDVQLSQVFEDSKTFVDATAKAPYDSIYSQYLEFKDNPDFNLETFVDAYFELPQAHKVPYKTDTTHTATEHIHALWPVLTKRADSAKAYQSLIHLPNPYVIPGGRFREVYYWDSYFTMLGLAESDEFELMEDILDNFCYLIDEVGHIPNGNRTYYVSRSQPPFFAQMIDLLAQHQGKQVYATYRNHLRKEYEYWMQQDTTQQAFKHTINTPLGIMNRYFDERNQPRQESFREDYRLAKEHPEDSLLNQHLRAGAESGWDFSSRWLANGTDLKTIETLDIIPVDLLALMYGMESVLIKSFEGVDEDFVRSLKQSQEHRLQFLNAFCWNESVGVFEDYHWKDQKQTGRVSLATVYPLYFKMATQEQANRIADYIQKHFLKPGGVVTTKNHTGQQWDAPNGWAPLQWITVVGLEHYGHEELAQNMMKRWVALNEKVFHETGKFVEKYDVEDLEMKAGGGEYPLQDGFGWSNGVYLAFKEKLKH